MVITVSSIFWVLMWKSNEMVSFTLNRSVEWLKAPVKRFIWGIVGHVLCTLIVISFMDFLLEYFYDVSINMALRDYMFSVAITLAITFVLYSRNFLMAWRELSVKDEKLQRENILSKYEALKNQVNPHFLFNSFNTLTSLIYEDADTAAEYVKELSNLYRYILETKEMETVPIDHEMKLVNSYIFLQKKRFGEALKLETSLMDPSVKVAPLGIQMLVENAIKHNIIDHKNPLTIQVGLKNEALFVINNLQRKDIVADGPGNIGLNNLKARYEYLAGKEIVITNKNGLFKVELPVLR